MILKEAWNECLDIAANSDGLSNTVTKIGDEVPGDRIDQGPAQKQKASFIYT